MGYLSISGQVTRDRRDHHDSSLSQEGSRGHHCGSATTLTALPPAPWWLHWPDLTSGAEWRDWGRALFCITQQGQDQEGMKLSSSQ